MMMLAKHVLETEIFTVPGNEKGKKEKEEKENIGSKCGQCET